MTLCLRDVILSENKVILHSIVLYEAKNLPTKRLQVGWVPLHVPSA